MSDARDVQRDRQTALVLWILLALDVILAIVALGVPEIWFRIVHGTPVPAEVLYVRRTGAQWAGFALVQAIAIVRWRKDARWLAAVAGVRLCDVFTDLTALTLMHERTAFAWVALLATGPGNVAIARLLFRRAKR